MGGQPQGRATDGPVDTVSPHLGDRRRAPRGTGRFPLAGRGGARSLHARALCSDPGVGARRVPPSSSTPRPRGASTALREAGPRDWPAGTGSSSPRVLPSEGGEHPPHRSALRPRVAFDGAVQEGAGSRNRRVIWRPRTGPKDLKGGRGRADPPGRPTKPLGRFWALGPGPFCWPRGPSVRRRCDRTP